MSFSTFQQSLRPASFRGVPFAVTGGRKVFGRRQAVHDYPFRDTIWVEDLGRQGRRLTLTGFIISDSLIYGGGDVLAQQEQLIAAAEGEGPGLLVHPTLGELTVSCPSLAIDESFDSLGAFAIEFSFIEAGGKVFPSLAIATQDTTTAAAATLDVSAGEDADRDVEVLAGGAPATNQAADAAGAWTDQISAAVQDATSIANLASQLPGQFGRYFNGGNLGGLGGILATVFTGDTTVASLIADAANAVGAVGSLINSALTIAGSLGLGASSNSFADLAAGAQSCIAGLLTCTADPRDAIRLLITLSAASPAGVAPATAPGVVVGAVFRRAALAGLARASSLLQPSSSTDASDVLGQVTAAFDAEIAIAGDSGDDASFAALRALRVAVIQDLNARGAQLAPMTTVQSFEAVPSLVLAQRLYRDAGRATGLEQQSACVHPLFLPLSFEALAA